MLLYTQCVAYSVVIIVILRWVGYAALHQAVIFKLLKTSNRNIYQVSEKDLIQEPKQDALSLLGSRLRPENFDLVHTLLR